MAEFLERRMILAATTETTEGTVVAPAGSDANLLVYDVKFQADIAMFERKPISSTLSPYASISGTRKATLTFKVELKGSGTAGTAPKLGKLLTACGFGETVVALTSAAYAPKTTGVDSLTIDVFSVPASGNHIRARMAGARGTCRLSPKVGEPVMLEFTFSGVYVGVTDESAITASGLETTKPQPFLNTSFSMHSYSGHKVSGFNIDLGNTVTMRTDISQASGFLSALITEKAPTFSFDAEKELVLTHDYYGKMLNNTEGSMSVAIGATAGNICTITAPKAQYIKISEGSRDGIAIYQIDGKFNRSSGNDELVITFT
jgi:hypothetical protein